MVAQLARMPRHDRLRTISKAARRHPGVQPDADQRDHGRQGDPAPGHSGFVHPAGELRCGAGLGHRVQDPTGGVQAGVERRQRRGQHDHVHDRVDARPADRAEERDERADPGLVGGVGQQQGQQEQRPDVEHRDPRDDGVDRPRHDLGRVLRLARGGADQLDPGVGEHHALHDDHGGEQPVGQPAAVVGDQAEADRVPVDGRAEGDEVDADPQEGQQRGHLDQREPELQLPEHLHRHEVQGEHDDQRGQGEGPLRHRGERRPVPLEEVHVEGHAGHVDHRDGGPGEPVEPADGVGGLLAEELAGVGDERPGRRPVQDELAQRAQDQEAHEPGEGVDEQQRRPGGGQPAAGAEEQAGADGAADGDHLDLPRLERLVVALLLLSEHFTVVAARASG